MIEEYIEKRYGELIELLETLTVIPAPSFCEKDRELFCRQWLYNKGIQTKTDKAGNMIYEYNLKEKNIIFMAHLDTVFPKETKLSIKRENGKIMCPGISDDTVNVVAIMMLIEYLDRHKIDTEYGIILCANVCEEGLGNLYGCRELMEAYKDRVALVVSFDLYRNKIFTDCIGSVRYEVTTYTKGGHSYGDFGNANAIEKLAQLINDLYQYEVPQNSNTTYNVGTISGGTSVNTIAQSAKMLFEYRSDKYEALKHAEEYFYKQIENNKSAECDITCEVVGNRPCSEVIDREYIESIADRVADIIAEVTGDRPTKDKASTDCNIPLSMGIPAICYGLCKGGGAHTLEEWLEEDSIKNGMIIALRTFLEINA